MGKSSNRYKRMLIVCLAVTTSFSVIVGALFYWQIIAASRLQRSALGQWTSTTTVAASRGTIYDATGEVMAISAAAKSLQSTPRKIKSSGVDPSSLASALVSVLGSEYEYETVLKKVTYDKENAISTYVIARNLTAEQIAYIEALNISGLKLVDDVARYYPKGATLAQVLGSVNVDGVGNDGLELKYDKYLRGLSGKILSSADVVGGQIPGGQERYIDATNGVNLVLTIDYVIQKFAEDACRDCLATTGAKSVQCIVMDPNTAAVKAMVNLPDYDLNSSPADVVAEYSRNDCILDTYEPGSTFKVITLSAALEEGKVNENSTFYCNGYQQVDGEKIKCWRTVPHGSETLAEAVCNSCNPAFMQMGLALGKDTFYQYLSAFGFDKTTGIDFSADQDGLLMAPKYVRNTDLARMAFGQSVAVTPLQLITAVSAAVNGGTLYQPYLVAQMKDDNGNVLNTAEPVALRRVISPSTSATVRKLLENVVATGSGKNAQVEGYRVGGKTGTAQKYRDGVIVRGVHVASFMGFAPADDPKMVVLFVVDEPNVAVDFGSVVAAPYAGTIMKKTLQYMQIPASEPEEKEYVTVPNLEGYSVSNAETALKAMGLQMLVEGKGSVVSQTPAANEKVEKYSIIKVKGSQAVDAYTDTIE